MVVSAAVTTLLLRKIHTLGCGTILMTVTCLRSTTTVIGKKFNSISLILNGRRREIVSEAAYSLFYRLRTSSEDLKTLNYEKIKQVPDQQFLDEIRKYEESKKK